MEGKNPWQLTITKIAKSQALFYLYIYILTIPYLKRPKHFFLSDNDCQIQAVDGFSRKYCMFENDLFLGTFYIITPC